MIIRLDKFISRALLCSRKEAKDFIVNCLNKKPNDKIDSNEIIEYNGQKLIYKEHYYIVMNKPEGVVSATEDSSCKTVLNLLPTELQNINLVPAGRLDKYTTGLIILTDDGTFVHKLTTPNEHKGKTYEFVLDNPILNDELVKKFAKGVYLGDDKYSSPAELIIKSPNEGIVTIYEGIYHQVKRMFDQNKAHVVKLNRIKIGNLFLPSDLKLGDYRELTEKELEELNAT